LVLVDDKESFVTMMVMEKWLVSQLGGFNFMVSM